MVNTTQKKADRNGRYNTDAEIRADMDEYGDGVYLSHIRRNKELERMDKEERRKALQKVHRHRNQTESNRKGKEQRRMNNTEENKIKECRARKKVMEYSTGNENTYLMYRHVELHEPTIESIMQECKKLNKIKEKKEMLEIIQKYPAISLHFSELNKAIDTVNENISYALSICENIKQSIKMERCVIFKKFNKEHDEYNGISEE